MNRGWKQSVLVLSRSVFQLLLLQLDEAALRTAGNRRRNVSVTHKKCIICFKEANSSNIRQQNEKRNGRKKSFPGCLAKRLIASI